MTTLAIVIVVLLLLVTGLLASSIHLELRLDPDTARGAARWALVSVAADARARVLEVRLVGWRVMRRSWSELGGDEREEAKPRPKRRRRRRSQPWRDALDGWPFYRRQLGIGLSRIHVDRCRGALRLATPDPALTGILYGAVYALSAPFARERPARFSVDPDFVGTFPGGWLDVALRVRLGALAGLAWRITWYERSRRGATEKGR
jgi:hypothetical protein